MIRSFWPEMSVREQSNGSRSCDRRSVSVSGSRDDPVGHAREHSERREDFCSGSDLGSPRRHGISRTVFFLTRPSCGPCSHRTPVFVSTSGTSRHWRLGLAQNRIARGGRASSEIPGVPASGTRPISCGAAWRPSSMTFQRPSASCVSRRVVLRRVACLRRANGPRPPTPRVSRTSRRLHP